MHTATKAETLPPLSGAWLAFYGLASLPLVLLALLFAALLSFTPARAESVSCAGKDLLTEMQAKDPAKYAGVVAEAGKVPNGRGIFWKVEKPGLQTSYLLGTMHLTDPRVLGMPKGAKEALAASRIVVVESDEILDEKKAAAGLLARPDLTMFTDGTTISGLLGKDQTAKLAEGLKAHGIALALVDRMKPWMIASFVSLPACEMERKASGTAFLDKSIAEQAVAGGKELVGLETMQQQLQAMNDLPVKFHLKALIDTLDLGKRMDDITATMLDLYAHGDVGMIVPMLNATTADTGGSASDYAAFEQRIVTDRNHVMATRSASSFARGGVFMAVGALHLPGKEGVISLLRDEGYRVTLVP